MRDNPAGRPSRRETLVERVDFQFVGARDGDVEGVTGPQTKREIIGKTRRMNEVTFGDGQDRERSLDHISQ